MQEIKTSLPCYNKAHSQIITLGNVPFAPIGLQVNLEQIFDFVEYTKNATHTKGTLQRSDSSSTHFHRMFSERDQSSCNTAFTYLYTFLRLDPKHLNRESSHGVSTKRNASHSLYFLLTERRTFWGKYTKACKSDHVPLLHVIRKAFAKLTYNVHLVGVLQATIAYYHYQILSQSDFFLLRRPMRIAHFLINLSSMAKDPTPAPMCGTTHNPRVSYPARSASEE